MTAIVYKSIFDKDGIETKMAGRIGADGIFRPVHHSDIQIVQIEVTRPADANAYVAGDVIGANVALNTSVLFEFDLGALGIGAGLLVSSRLIRNSVLNQSTRFRASFHDAVPNTLPAGDNAPGPLLYANRLSRRGWADFTNPLAGDAGTSDCLDYAGVLSNPQGIPFNLPADGKLLAMLGVRDAVTLASAEKLALEIGVVV